MGLLLAGPAQTVREEEPEPRLVAAIAGRGAAAGNIGETTLHFAHVRGEEPVPCADCHTIDPDGFAVPDRERCLGCHVERDAALHAAVDDPDVRQCTKCHDFLDTRPTAERAWQCAACHEKPPHGDQMSMTGDLAETCGRCHTPHGESSLAPASCSGCHEEQAEANQHVADTAGTKECLACHRQHDAAKNAIGRCAECHRDHEPRVPASATFAGGHEECVGCHRPHTFSKKTTRSCTSCHDHQQALASERVAEHARCRSCHDQHDVQTDAKKSCQRCHDRVHPDHPASATGSDCLGCHPAHPKRGGNLAVVACTSCHKTKARSDTDLHGGADCTACHQQHDFRREPGAGFCLGCHQRRVGGRDAIAVSTGHGDCTKCHGGDPHAPKKPPTCGTCHREQAKTAPDGHATCTNCHDRHLGGLASGVAACTGCHKDRKKGPHAGIDGGCRTCHRPHGPDGVAKPPTCTTCHERADLAYLHGEKGHATCTDCHQSHVMPKSDRAVCERCHDDRKDHEPSAATCRGCHPFSKEGE